MIKKIGISIFMISLLGNVLGQQIEDRVEIIFNLDKFVVDPSIKTNRESLQNLRDLIDRIHADSLISITSISIDSYASPEGSKIYNQKLSQRRSQSMSAYLQDKLSIADSLITITSGGVAWEQLRKAVAASNMEHRDEVINIIDNVPEETWRYANPTDKWLSLVDSRNKHLMDLRGGKPYRYMQQHIFAPLRSSSIVSVYFRYCANLVSDTSAIMDSSKLKPLEFTTPIYAAPINRESTTTIHPLFAVKTNLLFDALSLINIEVEVPIGKKFSVAGEWVFPWWTMDDGTPDSKRNRTQLLNGNIEAKYWFGKRNTMPIMTGWFAGLYAGGGLYDFERDAKGYQGEFFIAAGLSGGYAHTISKSGNLRMEYSLGVGYLKTDYRYYEAEYLTYDNKWHPIKLKTGTYTWLGPTKAKVSLVWLLNHKSRKGGVL